MLSLILFLIPKLFTEVINLNVFLDVMKYFRKRFGVFFADAEYFDNLAKVYINIVSEQNGIDKKFEDSDLVHLTYFYDMVKKEIEEKGFKFEYLIFGFLFYYLLNKSEVFELVLYDVIKNKIGGEQKW